MWYGLGRALASTVLVAALAIDAWAEPLRVGIFADRQSPAQEVISKGLKEDGIESRPVPARDITAGKAHDCAVLYIGEGWGSYDWLDRNGRMQLVEYVQKRGCGVVFSMFRCGSAARSLIRPIFPEVAYAYNKANSPGIRLTEPKHPVVGGLPAEFMTPYWDHAVLMLGPDGRMLAQDMNGDVAIACGEVGLGRVVFIGPWIGLDATGKPVSPLPDVDAKLLVNAVRWAAGSTHRRTGGDPTISDDVRLKVLRREKMIDWLHDERGVNWYAGILAQSLAIQEQKLDDLQFRAGRLVGLGTDPGLARRVAGLREELGRLQTQLRQRYDEARREKAAEISRMGVEDLEKEPSRSLVEFRGMTPAQKAREEENVRSWGRRLLAPHDVAPLETDLVALEGLLVPALANAREKQTAEEASKDAASVPGLIAELESPDRLRRGEVALELGRIGDPRAVPALLKAIQDEDYAVRRNAIHALGWMRVAQAVPELLRLVESTKDVWTKRRAVQALGLIGDPQATDRLIRALTDADHFVRQNAILSLGWLGDEKAVDPLLQILESPSVEVGLDAPPLPKGTEYTREDRICAIRALGHIGKPDALSRIRKFAEEHPEKSGGWRFNPCLAVGEAADLAAREIEDGGRKEKGIVQPAFLKQREHFYWLAGKFNAIYGRYWDYGDQPRDVRVMAGYAAGSGGTGLIQWRSADALVEKHPGGDEHMALFSELGLKQNPCFRWRDSAVMDKAGFERDVLRWGQYPALGGFWAEEGLSWDRELRNDERFRKYLSAKYRAEALTNFGIADVSAVKCPEPDEDRGKVKGYSHRGTDTEKFLFAEYVEYLADTGVEIWQETQEWLTGLRKGTVLTFSLSQRYVKGGSTYIRAYPKISQVIGANGPQSYEAHSYANNFDLDMVCDGESRPALGEFYAHQADVAGRVERGFASAFLHGQCFFVWWWGHVFKHAPDSNGGCGCWGPGRWEAAERQFRKGKAISQFLSPLDTQTVKVVAQLYSGRTATLSYGRGTVDGMGGFSSGGRMHRYTQNQQAVWESLIQSHLPVDMVWLETMSPEKLNRYPVAVLSDAKSIRKEEADWLRAWVQAGGCLIATGGAARHDPWDRPLSDYALADVFGVKYVSTQGNGAIEDTYLYVERDLRPGSGISTITVRDEEWLKGMDGKKSVEYEKGLGCDVVEITTGRAVGLWEDGTPAVIENRYGRGTCIFLCPVYPGLSHRTKGWAVDDLVKDYWDGARELIAGSVRRGMDLAGRKLPIAAVNCPKEVEVGLRIQPRFNRWVVHLLNCDPKLDVVRGAEISVQVPSIVGLKAYYPYPREAGTDFQADGDSIRFSVRDFSVHEMVVLEWAGKGE